MKSFWPILLFSFFLLTFQQASGLGVTTNEEEIELKAGSTIYKMICVACHTPGGKSPLEDLNLSDDKWKHGNSLETMQKIINQGVADTAMVGFAGKLSKEEIRAVAKYIQTFSSHSSQPKP